MKNTRNIIWNDFFKALIPTVVILVLLLVFGIKCDAVGIIITPAVVAPVLMIRCYYNSVFHIMRFVKEKGITIEELLEDISSSPRIGSSLIGSKYIMSLYKRRTALEYSDIMWAYKLQMTKVPESWSVFLVTGPGQRHEISLVDESVADSYIEMIRAKCPHAIIGFSKELNNNFIHDYNTFRYVVEQRKAVNR